VPYLSNNSALRGVKLYIQTGQLEFGRKVRSRVLPIKYRFLTRMSTQVSASIPRKGAGVKETQTSEATKEVTSVSPSLD